MVLEANLLKSVDFELSVKSKFRHPVDSTGQTFNYDIFSPALVQNYFRSVFPRAAVFEFSLDCPFFLELGKFRIEPLDISKKPKHKFKWANDDTLKNHSFSVPDIPFPDTRRFQIFMIEYARVNYYWGSLILRRDA